MTTHSEAEPFLTPVPNDPRSPAAKSSAMATEAETPDGNKRPRRLPKCKIAKENVLLILTVCGCIAGIILGLCLRNTGHDYSKRELSYIKFPGEIFIRMLKMCILPLIVSSIM